MTLRPSTESTGVAEVAFQLLQLPFVVPAGPVTPPCGVLNLPAPAPGRAWAILPGQPQEDSEGQGRDPDQNLDENHGCAAPDSSRLRASARYPRLEAHEA